MYLGMESPTEEFIDYMMDWLNIPIKEKDNIIKQFKKEKLINDYFKKHQYEKKLILDFRYVIPIRSVDKYDNVNDFLKKTLK